MGAAGDGVAVGTCPAELAPQARYLYGRGLGGALVMAAKEHGWTVDPQPHIAYRTSPPAKRLYMLPSPSIEALDYVASWQAKGGLRRIGGNYAREDVEHELWRWLKQMGFADDRDDAVLQRFLDECLRRWPANMRPGLRIYRIWTAGDADRLGDALAAMIRSEFDAVFSAVHERPLSSLGSQR